MPDPIKELYKYYPINEYLLATIKGSQIWFSHPDSFNDPFDCRIKYAYIKDERYEKKVKEILKKERNRPFRDSKDYFTEKMLKDIADTMGRRNDFTTKLFNIVAEMRQKKIGVSCFSEKHNNILMWAHYADSHKGVCLKFNTTDQAFFADTHPVTYVKRFPSVKERTEYLNPERFLFYTKAKDWEYESEVRVLKEPNKLYEFSPNVLESVYFGVKCSKKDILKVTNTINELEKYKDIKFYQMQLDKKGFELVEEEIDSKSQQKSEETKNT
ncbi:DUF2971 domain-containing protein [uncultured Draconibacterium sp.]|uniref:DUF2971 domain-containing protein n=1 Tax=uncultured Draconibacterium sp. TaxID=1573823 RepID=UPI0032164973